MAALAPAALALAAGPQLRLRRRRGAREAGLAAVERGWRLSHVAQDTSPGRAGKVPKRTTLRRGRDEFRANQRLVRAGRRPGLAFAERLPAASVAVTDSRGCPGPSARPG